MAQIYLRLQALYAEGGRRASRSDPQAHAGPTRDPNDPTPDELAKEINGYALEDVTDPNDPTKVLLRSRQAAAELRQLRDDGTTACGCWIYSGCFTEAGNMMARRDTTDPDELGIYPELGASRGRPTGASSTTAPRPTSTASRGIRAQDCIEWNGSSWTGFDVPDYRADRRSPTAVGPFIMNPEGIARLFARGMMRDGPFPAHYEPFEAPIANPLHPKVRGNPVARVFKDDMEAFGDADEFPYRGDHLSADRALPLLDQARARSTRCCSRSSSSRSASSWRRRRASQHGGWVEVWSKRGAIKAKAVVTKRIRPLMCDGKPCTSSASRSTGASSACREGLRVEHR